VSAWLTRHLQTCVGSLGRLASQRLSALLTMLVIGIALALPACLHVLLSNAQVASGDLDSAADLSLYLKMDTSAAQADAFAAALRTREDIAAVRLIKADEALREFREQSGFGEALNALQDNPLPHTVVVRPASGISSPAQLEALAGILRSMSTVDWVQLDRAWVERLNAILDTLRRAVWVVAGLLAFGVLVIVGKTIGADIQARRAEIEVVKLLGGSDAFTRRPFLYAGFWYGLGGGLIALTLSYVVVLLLAGPVHRLAALYGSTFTLSGLGPVSALKLLGLGCALGWVGSWAATARHLKAIQPQ
jgi:cell division transport system permease protein